MRITLSSFAHLLRKQALYIAFSLAVAAIFWAVGQEINPLTILVYSISLGNLTEIAMQKATPLYGDRAFPYNWLIFLLVLAVLVVPIYLISSTLVWWIAPPSPQTLGHYLQTGWKFPILITVLFSVGIFLYQTTRDRLERRNRELQRTIAQGVSNRTTGRRIAACARDPAGAASQADSAVAGVRSGGSMAPGTHGERRLFRCLSTGGPQAVHLHCGCGGQGRFGGTADGACPGRGSRALQPVGQPGELMRTREQAAMREPCDGEVRDVLLRILDGQLCSFKVIAMRASESDIDCMVDRVRWTKMGRCSACFRSGSMRTGRFAWSRRIDFFSLPTALQKRKAPTRRNSGRRRLPRLRSPIAASRPGSSRTGSLESVSTFCGGRFQDDATLVVVAAN